MRLLRTDFNQKILQVLGADGRVMRTRSANDSQQRPMCLVDAGDCQSRVSKAAEYCEATLII